MAFNQEHDMHDTPNAERDARIYQEFKARTRQAVLAARYGVSVTRIAQIVAMQKALEEAKQGVLRT